MPRYLTAAQLEHDLGVRDLTDPAVGLHAVQHLIERAVTELARIWPCDVRRCNGERIVSVEDNYDNLGFAPQSVARDARYTRYVDDRRMLRSHASAMVPPELRRLATEGTDDVLLVCPGIVFRRDAIDRLHTGTPHQLDLWRMSRRPMTDVDLDEMVSALLRVLVPESASRSEDRMHPYTLNGRQVDVERDGEWVEVWECGLAHPEVLDRSGLGSSFSGLALGMGLDRLLMLVKGIPDIRLLRSSDPRVLSQMGDLAPYEPVSAMPPIVRDISIAVEPEDMAEDLGDRVREALGEDGSAVEEVRVLSETPFDQLPRVAGDRLGARQDQKNVLVRVVLRDLDRTLRDEEANLMRDLIYTALHRGTVFHWAVGPPETA
jgi:phenylalanyl-tRNA synthetase alpha chain